MPNVDLPVDDRSSYQSHSPFPEDFDAYWGRALNDLESTTPDARMVPADFRVPGVECFDLWFQGTGGACIHAKYLRPEGRRACRSIIQFHGYASGSGDWSERLALVAAGFCVAALDCRGQGGLSEDIGGVRGNTLRGHIIRGLESGAEHLLFRDIYLDAVQLARIVMVQPEVDPRQVSTMGWSQGGGLALACAALEPRIRKTVSVYPFLCDFRRVWEMDLDVAAYEELRTWFRLYDPRHLREKEFFHSLGYIDIANLAPRIQSEVLLGCGLMDTICPPSTQFAAYNRIKSTKNVVFYPDFGHEGLPGFSDEAFRFLTR
jgi:cephalosporin-C deacetylase